MGSILYYTTEYNVTCFWQLFPSSNRQSGLARAGTVRALRIDVAKWGRRITFIDICQENFLSHQHVHFLVTEVILHWRIFLPTCFSADANSTIRFVSACTDIRFDEPIRIPTDYSYADKVRLVLVLFLIGWKAGTRFLITSVATVITFDSHLKTALILSFTNSPATTEVLH